MSRALLSPVISACVAIAESTNTPVGDGNAPDCGAPYIVVSVVSSPRYDGPFLNDGEADSSDRIQFSFVGVTREQADVIRDKVRVKMTASNLDSQFVTLTANRRTSTVILDVLRGSRVDDRGLPKSVFVGSDQYLIETTPFTP